MKRFASKSVFKRYPRASDRAVSCLYAYTSTEPRYDILLLRKSLQTLPGFQWCKNTEVTLVR